MDLSPQLCGESCQDESDLLYNCSLSLLCPRSRAELSWQVIWTDLVIGQVLVWPFVCVTQHWPRHTQPIISSTSAWLQSQTN